jgi:hypothetical protein
MKNGGRAKIAGACLTAIARDPFLRESQVADHEERGDRVQNFFGHRETP